VTQSRGAGLEASPLEASPPEAAKAP